MVDTLVLGTSAQAWEFESLHAQFDNKTDRFIIGLFLYLITALIINIRFNSSKIL